MYTPQEIQEQTFAKAVFGGYDMQQVDDFLEPLTEDYITLYKENAVLKSKMKILVEKLEEYRAQEAELKRAASNAQLTCDKMIAEAQAKCADMMREAEGSARTQTASLQQSLVEEQERTELAKQAARSFIEAIEQDVRGHLELLEKLKSRDLASAQPPKPQREKPYDWSKHEQPPMVVPTQSAEHATPTAEDIASEISENLEKLVGSEEPEPQSAPAAVSHPESATIKFTDLKFGKNYDPTSV